MGKFTFSILILIMSAGPLLAQPFGYSPLQVQSLFNEEFRNQQYDMALLYGRWLIDAHPKEMEEHPGRYPGERNFRRMIDIYMHYADENSDPAVKEAYLDSTIQMYDRVIALFTEEEIDLYRWIFNRGRHFQDNADHIPNGFQRAIEDYETMFQMDTERATQAGNGYYVQLLVHHYSRLNDRDQVFAIMNRAEPYANERTLEFFAQTRNDLITDPAERIALLLEDYDEIPDDMELIEELFELYQALGDTDMISELSIRLYELDPSLENIMRLVDEAENNANFERANRFLAEAHALQEGSARARTSHRIAENHLNLRNLQEARRFARRAAQEDTGWGEPLITIATIYGQAVSRCAGAEMTRVDRVVYWLVLDYLDRALARNSGVQNAVNRLYRTYEPVTPSAEDKFYQGWEVGASIRVDGSLKECYAWIAEDTTVR